MTAGASAGLFDELKIRDVTLRNRIAVSPMCEYSCVNGLANDWHLVHLGSRAVGGAGLVITEATAVLPEARISPQDLGLWSDAHIEPLARITKFIHSQGSVAGIQLAHAGRKASTARPWEGGSKVGEEKGGWSKVVAPSAVAFAPNYPMPQALTAEGIGEAVAGFGKAAQRSLDAGFRVIEIHAAHGYLLHEFLSPFSNRRTDNYGGSFENRTRIVREVVESVRRVWPEQFPLFIRISSTDWTEGGWDIEQSVELVRILSKLGVDLVDCSSGGNVADAKIPRRAHPDRRCRHDHRGGSSRQDHRQRPGRSCAPGARNAARSVLAAPCRGPTGQDDLMACAIPSRRAYWSNRAAGDRGGRRRSGRGSRQKQSLTAGPHARLRRNGLRSRP